MDEEPTRQAERWLVQIRMEQAEPKPKKPDSALVEWHRFWWVLQQRGPARFQFGEVSTADSAREKKCCRGLESRLGRNLTLV
ncbi:MAG TPA: hypothetical protein VIZ66_06170 [Sphingomicrobium sp.]